MDLHDGLGDGAEQDGWQPPGSEPERDGPTADEETQGMIGYDGADGDGADGYEDAGGDAGSGSAPGYADSAAGTDEPRGGSPAGSSGRPGTMIVDTGGETRELPAEHDYTGDGRPDAAAETADGRVVVFADTGDNETGAAGPDGRADEAYVVDKRTGRVVSTAHIDPASGRWVEDTDTDGPTAAGTGPEPTGSSWTPEAGGTTDPDDHGTPSDRGTPGDHASQARPPEPGTTGDHGTPGTTDTPSDRGTPGDHGSQADPTDQGGVTDPSGAAGGSVTITVELGGAARELPAEHDYTGDGRPDAAAETADGRVVVFADTGDNETGAAGPDGRADEAYVVDKQTGRVVGAAHVDPRTGEWVEGDADTDGPPAAPSGDREVDS